MRLMTIGIIVSLAVFLLSSPLGAQSTIRIVKEVKLSVGSEPAGICVADDGTLWITGI